MTVIDSPPADTFALVVGGGPVGLYAAISLAHYGYRSVVLERSKRRRAQPKAHAINSRSLEIFRQKGIQITELKKLAADPADSAYLRFESSLAGDQFGSFLYERQDEAVKEFTPEPLLNIPQPKLETYLRSYAEKTGLITIYDGWQWQSCTQTSSGSVRSQAIRLGSGHNVQIESKYLLACDGAHSRARTALGITTKVPPSAYPTSARYVSVMISSDWRKYRDGMLHVVIQGEELRVFIVYDRASNWVFMLGVSHDDPVEKFTEEYCREAIDKAVGEKTDYEIANIVSWEASLRISDFYRSKTVPNAFVAGDAAHTFPNAGGLGVNTGFADVHNLAWKIHAVESGWTTEPDTLLDTYTTERKPVAEVSCKVSDFNQFRITEICSKVDSTMKDDPGANYQDPLKRKLLEDTINSQWSFSDHLNLHLGYAYGAENLGFVPHGNEEIPANSMFYKPKCVRGVRLPHAWITHKGDTKSTLDLVDLSSFTVFAAAGPSNVPEFTEGTNKIPLVFQKLDRDFTDMNGSWSSIMGLNEGQGLVLVRPDHHILGRVSTIYEINELLLHLTEGQVYSSNS